MAEPVEIAKAGKAAGRRLSDPRFDPTKVRRIRPIAPDPASKLPRLPGTPRIPWWGGPVAVGVGGTVYPRPVGCQTYDCPDYQDVVREFCRHSPSSCQPDSKICEKHPSACEGVPSC